MAEIHFFAESGLISVSVHDLPYEISAKVADIILNTVKGRYFKEDKEFDKRQQILDKSVQILENLPDYQLRLKNELECEIPVQDFIYPVLKSHFRDLQEEDYLPKVAGVSSKPDFGIVSLGVAYEIKYASNSKKLKVVGEEIAVDSRKYFGIGSPYKQLIVLIYNGANEATPANYITDLENMDTVYKVIISPRISVILNKKR